MKQILFKAIRFFFIGFTLLLLFRLIYGFVAYPNGAPEQSRIQNTINNFSFSGKNYASTKMARKSTSSNQARPAPSASSIDQKYEKVASVGASTSSFAKDEERVRQMIKEFNALIQFEQSSGLEDRRYLQLAIGVDPEQFDRMTVRLQKIGTLSSIRIDKTDKTSEYKDLQAQRNSLVKTLQNLVALKGQGGKIEELMQLEAKVLEMEEKIQNLGLSLGEFDEENEFCTIKYSLQEYKSRTTNISFLERIKTAIDWTVRTYCYLFIGLFFACGTALVVAFIFRLLFPLINRYWKEES